MKENREGVPIHFPPSPRTLVRSNAKRRLTGSAENVKHGANGMRSGEDGMHARPEGRDQPTAGGWQ